MLTKIGFRQVSEKEWCGSETASHEFSLNPVESCDIS